MQSGDCRKRESYRTKCRLNDRNKGMAGAVHFDEHRFCPSIMKAAPCTSINPVPSLALGTPYLASRRCLLQQSAPGRYRPSLFFCWPKPVENKWVDSQSLAYRRVTSEHSCNECQVISQYPTAILWKRRPCLVTMDSSGWYPGGAAAVVPGWVAL